MGKNEKNLLNAYVSKQVREINGRKYLNLYLNVNLNNGKVASIQVKPSFYNHKLNYLLECNLPEHK